MYTNYCDVPFVLAVWLAANDGYDLVPDPNTVSATSLMKPIRSLVLGARVAVAGQETVVDVSDLIPARVGTAVHSAAENAWLYSREKGMKNLGIPDGIIDKIRVNPEEVGDPRLDVYMEQRSQKKIGKWTISGKFDFVHEGRVKDIKTTKVYNWIKHTNDEKYMIQGSIYRWLNPEIITDDYVEIMMVFADWSAMKVKTSKDYPPKHIMSRMLPLMSLEQTEVWIKARLTELEAAWDKDQKDLPYCTPEELWMAPAKYAYYKDASKTSRATKLFDTQVEAQARKAMDGFPNSNIVERKADPKFCNYCDARQICMQAADYVNQGILTL